MHDACFIIKPTFLHIFKIRVNVKLIFFHPMTKGTFSNFERKYADLCFSGERFEALSWRNVIHSSVFTYHRTIILLYQWLYSILQTVNILPKNTSNVESLALFFSPFSCDFILLWFLFTTNLLSRFRQFISYWTPQDSFTEVVSCCL